MAVRGFGGAKLGRIKPRHGNDFLFKLCGALFAKSKGPIVNEISSLQLAFYWTVLYFWVGSLMLSAHEGWSTVDSVYFLTYTMTTIGYGDITPTVFTDKAFMVFVMVWAVLGVSVVAGFVVELLSMVLDARDATIAHARNKILQTASASNARPPDAETVARLKALAEKDAATAAVERSGSPTAWARAVALFPVLGIVAWLWAYAFACGLIMCALEEDWTLIDGVYFALVTGTSIGYGDLSPSTELGRGLSILILPCAIVFCATQMGRLPPKLFGEEDAVDKLTRRLAIGLSLKRLVEMDHDGDASVSEFEFIKFMLCSADIVNEDVLNAIHARFASLDADGSGILSKVDLRKEPLGSNVARAEGDKVAVALQRWQRAAAGIAEAEQLRVVLATKQAIFFAAHPPRDPTMDSYAVMALAVKYRREKYQLNQLAAMGITLNLRQLRAANAIDSAARTIRASHTHGPRGGHQGGSAGSTASAASTAPTAPTAPAARAPGRSLPRPSLCPPRELDSGHERLEHDHYDLSVNLNDDLAHHEYLTGVTMDSKTASQGTGSVSRSASPPPRTPATAARYPASPQGSRFVEISRAPQNTGPARGLQPFPTRDHGHGHGHDGGGGGDGDGDEASQRSFDSDESNVTTGTRFGEDHLVTMMEERGSHASRSTSRSTSRRASRSTSRSTSRALSRDASRGDHSRDASRGRGGRRSSPMRELARGDSDSSAANASFSEAPSLRPPSHTMHNTSHSTGHSPGHHAGHLRESRDSSASRQRAAPAARSAGASTTKWV